MFGGYISVIQMIFEIQLSDWLTILYCTSWSHLSICSNDKEVVDRLDEIYPTGTFVLLHEMATYPGQDDPNLMRVILAGYRR